MHNNNAQKTTKQRRRIPSLNADARIELRIKRLRILVGGGRLHIKYFQGKGCKTTSAKIWDEFRWVEMYDFPKILMLGPCVQGEILSAMARHGPLSAEVLKQDHNTALLQARSALFDHFISESLFTKGWGQMLTMRYAYLAGRLLYDPYCIINDVFISSILAEGIDQYGVEFLRALADVQHNLNRRSKGVSDACLFMLATNWANPHCPFWLMTRGAIYKACTGLSIGLVVTESMIQERLKSLKLVRTASPPIVGVELNSDGKIEKFLVSNKLFGLIEKREFICWSGLKYCLVKRPARHRSYTRAEK